MPRNPSEMQRLHEEAVEQRNLEYKKMQDSRNNIALIAEMNAIKDSIKGSRMSKSDKEALVGRLRSVEKKLGIEGNNYNSSEF